MGDLKHNIIKLQLIDRSYIFIKGEIENVLMKVDKYIFSSDFVIVYREEDSNVSSRVVRPFVVTWWALINVVAGELILKVDNKEVISVTKK